MAKSGVKNLELIKVEGNKSSLESDLVAVEEPLEIRLNYGPTTKRKQTSLAITMRTPGHDFELVSGFLFNEGIIQSYDQIKEIKYCRELKDPLESENVVIVYLDTAVKINMDRFTRHFYISSSCGVCGKTSIESLGEFECQILNDASRLINVSTIQNLHKRINSQQTLFKHTGGLHAAALFEPGGELIRIREDIGRHNAVDKLIGASLYRQNIPLSDKIILVSGRAGFELVQKSLMAGIPVMVAIGAPSSLALDLARHYNMTLVGFSKEDRFNIYCGSQRFQGL